MRMVSNYDIANGERVRTSLFSMEGEKAKMNIPFRKNPVVSVKKPVYAMASTDGVSAEITLYGDIYESQPTDWWGDPVEGQFITLTEFLEDLKQIEGCKAITVRMNSYGGDAGVSNTIHNRLRELSRNGATVTCIVDGVAMSGGSIIMCACDTVKANPSSLIMIHKCWSFLFGGYNADEMREQAAQNDAWDKMQSEVYQRKTGLSNATIMHMMSNTTYMTGREAMEKGFVDELLEDVEPTNIAASADGRTLFVRGRQMHLAPGMFAPDTIPTVTPEASAAVETNTTLPEDSGNKGGSSMTIEDFRAQRSEEVDQIEAEARASVDSTEAINSAVQSERDRIAGIDEVASLFDPELVRQAKYGDHPCTAAELALQAAQAAARAGSQFLADAAADSDASGANGVGAAPGDEHEDPKDEKTPEDLMNAARANIKGLFKKEEK